MQTILQNFDTILQNFDKHNWLHICYV